ncbi:LysR family transcriptional regulator [Jiella sonneratiae]|uniref:LysR family transcriptional regulator n=1 Tax=Jiella sonneratiae TaxID=2816856 RepID=A0ABS3J5B6_9HYPH|nr:LysR family transcriptional regulator [Jiella sonneratiae]MBO0904842.1 LysR family transcriptional regulator [Jiella sonneratiae]
MDRNLRTFLAVVRAGNLTAAAEAVGLTQPALTKTIRRLEAEIGAPLFERSVKGMSLTTLGEMFLERARAIEAQWAQAREEAHAHTIGALREFRIASGAAYHMRIAPLLVRQLAQEFPDTRFVLDFDVAGAMLPHLVTGDIHLLLGALFDEPPEGIVTERLLQVMTGAMCCSTNPLARMATVPPQALEGGRWVIYKRDALMWQRLAGFCLQHRLSEPQVVMEIDALASSMMVVKGTNFLTAAPTTLRPMAEQAGLVVLPLEQPIWTFPSGAWMRRSTRGYPILRRSIEILHQLVRTETHHSGELSMSQN